MNKLIETFRIVYETRNFSKAAELLFISQPTVSAQIKQLEHDLKTDLFIRQGRKEIIATPPADILYEKSIDLLDEWKHLYQEIQDAEHNLVTIKIGASHTFALYILPDLIVALNQQFPQLNFSVQMLNSLEVINALEQHTIDLGIIEKPLSAKNVERYPLLNDQLVLAGNPTAGPWLVRESTSGVYYYMNRYLEENNIHEPMMGIQNNAIIAKLINSGFGCSILSKRAVIDVPYQDLGSDYLRKFYVIERAHNVYLEIEKCRKFIQQWTEVYSK
ncbi:LysR family transcriptional regulator [Paucilactobacillus nenjiangensis]|uniref:LysR family transcriptional regulator n=1 Tax=Paucilactobacillus nenjiangensis TaxID=1296540 RepID=A0A5P1X0A3_9LACO|nr:LysR family transcriptional regulator [Paucilactobacillus nenjiangensis]QER67246.1 LysR family transcriptional regulator [Paucilactobacillus nenjiangensis]